MKTKRIDMCNSLKNISLMAAVVLALRLASAQCDPPPSGLVAWWPGEGNANDIIGINNGVAQGGLNYTAGEVGQAFSFDGVSGVVNCGDSPLLAPSMITIAFWMNANSVPTNDQDPVSRWGSS